MNSIEAYIQFEPGLITPDGDITNESTRDFCRNFMAEFDGFITRVHTVLAQHA
jgi:chromate reductase